MLARLIAWLLLAAAALPTTVLSARSASDSRRLLSALQMWFEAGGGKFNDNVKLEADRDTGRLRVVTKPGGVRTNQEVVAVPGGLLLTPHVVNSSNPDLAPHDRLAAALVLEYRRGAASAWAPYIAVLPQAPLDTALYFTEEDDAALAHSYAAVLVHDARQEFEALVQRLRADPLLSSVTDGAGSPALRWAVSIVQSRAFTIAKPNDVGHRLHLQPFLAPGADMLNHSPTALVGWNLGAVPSAFAAQRDVFRIFTRQAYSRGGMEVFNHYQDFPNPRLLVNYGFVLPGNRHDTVPLNLAVPESGPKAVLLSALGLTGRQSVTRGAVSVELLNVIRVLAMDDTDLAPEGFRQLALLNRGSGGGGDGQAAASVGVDGEVVTTGQRSVSSLPTALDQGLPDVDAHTQHLRVPTDTDVRAHRLLLDALTSMMARYPSTLDDDRQLLADDAKRSSGNWQRSSRGKNSRKRDVQRSGPSKRKPADGAGLTPRQRAIIACRVAEREVLAAATDWLHYQLTHARVEVAATPGVAAESGVFHAAHAGAPPPSSAGRTKPAPPPPRRAPTPPATPPAAPAAPAKGGQPTPTQANASAPRQAGAHAGHLDTPAGLRGQAAPATVVMDSEPAASGATATGASDDGSSTQATARVPKP